MLVMRLCWKGATCCSRVRGLGAPLSPYRRIRGVSASAHFQPFCSGADRGSVRWLSFSPWPRCRLLSSQANSGAQRPAFGISFTSPWDVLGVNNDADLEEIDSAYRRLIFKHHPDHGGTTEDFLRVKQAREVLVARLDPDMELVGGSSTGSKELRRKGFGKRFEEAEEPMI